MKPRLFPLLAPLLSVALLPNLTGPVAAQEAATAKRETRTEEGVHRDLAYVPDGHERQRLDLMLPRSGRDWPLIVWVHGGAWRAGDKRHCPARPLVKQGYAVASINYRLSQHAVFPAQLEDCKTAIRWLRAHASEFGYDSSRIGVWGGSAGGHLVALLGTTSDTKEFDVGPNTEYSSAVQAVCDFYGPTDFLKMNEQAGERGRLDHLAPDSPESQLLGVPVAEHPELASRANPIRYISPDDPPFLIVHGDHDFTVPVGQSRLLADALKKAGVKVTLRVIEGGGHGLGNLGIPQPEMLGLVEAFFDRTLKGGAADEAYTAGSETKVIYKRTAQAALNMHLHFPEDWEPADQRPAIVFFFGGGWRQGTVEQFRPQAEYFARHGLVTARADYRVKSRHDVLPDACVEDAKSAIRWLRRHHARLGIDPERIVAAGGSAGGHLAAATATVPGFNASDEEADVSAAPNLLVLFNPVLNTSSVMDRMGSESLAKALSPARHLNKDTAPAIIFFGTEDWLLETATTYRKRARPLNVPAVLWTAEGARHGFFNRSPWLEETLYLSHRFLHKHGYLPAAPEPPPGGLRMEQQGHGSD